tara:strand:+ start:45 stop:659 length:615 start_codon:yes stop_codon:yes gene_type:complete
MNVLSIDLDWLQYPSRYQLEKLNRLFFTKVGRAKKIVFARNHHSIIMDLINENNITLHNIDHHHDIQYVDWQQADIEQGKVTHGCWVGNLLFEGRLKEYYWYNNLNSHLLTPLGEDGQTKGFSEEILLRRNTHFSIEDDLEKAWLINDYDLVFVCLSPEYLDVQWRCMYETYFHYCDVKHKEKTEKRTGLDLPNQPITISYGGQ